ncbi:MAG: hypothetical protein KatS3mg078_0832 [Deltaproteobacteria bacterium]|nr:MAG: hypothetical protein KatS3mg078_0832 [Deltaproteobacteria bacterium]
MGIIRKLNSNFNSVEEVILFFRIFLLITFLPLLTRFLSVPRLMKVITPRNLKVCKNLDEETRIEKLVKFTNYVLSFNFWIYKNTCLKRSLVLYHFLRRSGINVHICFGVRYKDRLPDTEKKKKLEGHAWLLYNGDIFLESNTEITKTYKVTYCFPEVKEEVGEAIINHS